MFWFESNIEPPESLYNQIYNVISNKCGSEHASVATSEVIRIIKNYVLKYSYTITNQEIKIIKIVI